jgi:Tfp pilus assembly protein PilO
MKLRSKNVKIGIIILIVLAIVGTGYSVYITHEQSEYDKKLTEAH